MAFADGTEEITNDADLIDSREVNARIEYLSDEDYECDEDEAAELAALRAVAVEGSGYGDWNHGSTLIRDSYFKTYAEDYAEDIGAIGRDAAWPANHIDWDAAADEIRIDYTSVDFAGVTYWIR